MTPYMPHYCGGASRFHEARRFYAAQANPVLMQERQKPIAEWMRDVMTRRDISGRAWSESAKLGKDTVSRAIRDDYPFVTSTSTIAKLADAIGEAAPGLAAAIPSSSALSGILQVLLEAVPGVGRVSDVLLLPLAEALRDTLLHLADEPEAGSDPKAATLLARASARQLRQLHA